MESSRLVTSWSADALAPALREMVDGELQLDAGERVLWTGQPSGRRMALATVPIFLFAIPWTAFAVFWVAAAAWGTSEGSISGIFRVFPLFGLPFIAIGLGMLSSPFWALRSAKRTVYVVTDRRAIIFGAGWNGMKVRSFLPERLGDMSRTQRADGSGDLIFATDVSTTSKGGQQKTDVGFMGIPAVRDVEQMVQAMVERQRLSPTGSRE